MIHSLYFTYLNAQEEGAYCCRSEEISARVSALAATSARVAEYLELFREAFGTELPTEILERHMVRDAARCNSVQMYLYLCAAEGILGEWNIAAFGSYSAGQLLAYVASGVLSPQQLLTEVGPILQCYVDTNREVHRSGLLTNMTLHDPDDQRFADRVYALMQAPEVVDQVWVSDDRAPYAVRVVGRRAAVRWLAVKVFEEFPAARARSTKAFSTDGSHLAFVSYDGARQRLKSVTYGRPTRPILSGFGGLADTASTSEMLGEQLYDAVYRPLNMRRCAYGLRAISPRMIVVGSEKAARFVVYGIAPERRPAEILLWENCLLDGPTAAALPFHSC